MAGFGAKRPRFAPIQGDEPTNALPQYDEAVTLGALVSANMTVNLATGQLFGDDVLIENVEEFLSATIPMETDDMLNEVAAVVLGASFDEETGERRDNTADNPPRGGLVYYKTLMRRGKKLYKGYYYPVAQAAVGNDNAQTKSNSIAFQTNTTNFTVFAPNVGDWRYTRESEDEQAVIAWCDQKLGQAAPSGNANLSALTIGSLALTPAFAADTTEYTADTTNATNTVTATAADSGAQISIHVGEMEINNGSAATWSDGENTVTITVTNGTAAKTYTIAVTKAE